MPAPSTTVPVVSSQCRAHHHVCRAADADGEVCYGAGKGSAGRMYAGSPLMLMLMASRCCCVLHCLIALQEELIESGVIKPPPEAALLAKAAAKGRKAAKRAQKASAASGPAAAAAVAAGGAAPRQYQSPSGFVVLVGRNNKQNDVLSHQIAKPGDVWMHVRGLPGSHTVLKLPSGQEPDAADLQFAADLAAYFSKARDAGTVDVIVARAEHLKKPRGAKPGQVLVSKEEGNVVGRPSSSVAAVAAASEE